MYPRLRLNWEDEVRISDALYAARETKTRLAGMEPATPDDRAILAAGVAAADELVTAHSGIAKRVASEVMFGAKSSATIDFEDLVQIGMIAMYSCANSFDARRRRDGNAHDTGNRFSVYCRKYIQREMWRAVRRGDAPLTGSVAIGERTQEWLRARDALMADLGRHVSAAEVSEACGIPVDAIDMTLAGPTTSLEQRRRPEGSDGPWDAPLGDVGVFDAIESGRGDEVVNEMVSEDYIAALDRTLRELLPPDEADAFLLYLGVDRQTPRAAIEVAREMGMRVGDANEVVGRAIARLLHPQNVGRVSALAREALDSIEKAETLIGAR